MAERLGGVGGISPILDPPGRVAVALRFAMGRGEVHGLAVDHESGALLYQRNSETPPLRVNPDGSWQQDVVSGQVDTLEDLFDLPEGNIREDAVTLVAVASLVLQRPSGGLDLPRPPVSANPSAN